MEILQKLCNLPGISGREDAVRDYIITLLPSGCRYKTDNAGNLIVFRQGRSRTGRTVMLSAHMDEVGLMVTAITKDGRLKFAAVGGIDNRILPGITLQIGQVSGVIGLKATHMLEQEDKDNPVDIDSMTIDIGAKDYDMASSAVKVGDAVTFIPNYKEFGDDHILSKALDDRVGCYILLELLKRDLPCDTYFVFTSSEEIGTRGAGVAAYNIKPDYAIIVETTTACDISGIAQAKQVCKLGGGAVLSFMDKSNLYNRELYSLATKLAVENGIAWQPKSVVAGGNEAGIVSRTGAGCKTIALSVPCRYLHTPAGVVKKSDIRDTLELTAAMTMQN
ncbi:MAG: M42 family peptidase [Oscillospiraceae bacterium]|nr:M42 family peptidase [Oscillospiraceae bacterium]